MAHHVSNTKPRRGRSVSPRILDNVCRMNGKRRRPHGQQGKAQMAGREGRKTDRIRWIFKPWVWALAPFASSSVREKVPGRATALALVPTLAGGLRCGFQF